MLFLKKKKNLTFCKYFVLQTSGKFQRIYLNVRFADQVSDLI